MKNNSALSTTAGKRDRTIDIAKGFGILCVILGHLGNNDLVRAIYSYHMPLFFFVSGWLLNEKRSPKEFFVKRLHALIPAYCFTVVCMFFLNVLLDIANHVTGEEIIRNAIDVLIRAFYGSGTQTNHTPWGIGMIGAIWFLPAMLWATSYVRWIIAVSTRPYVKAVIIVCTFAACYLSAKWLWLPFDIQAGGCASLFVYCGWAAKRIHKKLYVSEKYHIYSKYIIPIGFVAWLYMYYIGVYPFMVGADYSSPFLTVILPILIVVALMRISKKVQKLSPIAGILSFYGRYSLPILCFHLMELEYFPWAKIRFNLMMLGINYSSIECLILFLMKLILCTLLTLLVSRIKPIRNLFSIPAFQIKSKTEETL